MAQPSHQLFSIGRTCRQCIRSATRSQLSRSFSTTSSRRKVIPSFVPTGDEAIDNFFAEWRQKVFMPAALEPHHRNLIYKGKLHPTLLGDPGVTVTMDDDEEIKLEPRHAFDKPSGRKGLATLNQYLKNNQEVRDWDNAVQFLKGWVMAKNKYPAGFPAQLTRRACDANRDQVIIACTEAWKETGLSLRQKEVVRELMLYYHNKAVLAGFQGPDLETLSRRAERVVRLLEGQINDGGALSETEEDARRHPVVAAVLLELVAEKAVNRYDGEDRDGQVAKYASTLVHMQFSKSVPNLKEASPTIKNQVGVDAIPVWNSIKWALKVKSVKESELRKPLQEELNSVTKILDSLVKEFWLPNGPQKLRSMIMYGQVTDKTAAKKTKKASQPTPSASPA